MNLNQIIELAKDSEDCSLLDWAHLSIHRDSIYNILGSTVIEEMQKSSESDRDIILLTSLIKLTVENFMLEMILMGKQSWV